MSRLTLMPSPTPTPQRFDLVDLISALLQNEQANLFHFLINAGPYIHPSAAGLRRTLQTLTANTLRREGELVSLLADLGSTPKPAPVQPEHQYLAYLAIDFLLPKLIDAKHKSIAAYQRTLTLLGPHHPDLANLLSAHLAEHRAELQSLTASAAHLTARSTPTSQKPTPPFDPTQN